MAPKAPVGMSVPHQPAPHDLRPTPLWSAPSGAATPVRGQTAPHKGAQILLLGDGSRWNRGTSRAGGRDGGSG
ncbi:hypothetical protein GCM10025881_26040 [Pseudolysinimonas kribbensis]|uniref:Uncharacterized protein n=1 Tax=Pseudolysinimonas kribbensis TaxID=433641 RepID=A0ABQ6K854_9MICO|nr:hypothetical protein GCM10025881_26040 [Pseudolysinimonas kribbensis]